MKGTICSAVIPILLAAIVCSPVLARTPMDGIEVVVDLDTRWSTEHGDQSSSTAWHTDEAPSLHAPLSNGETPDDTEAIAPTLFAGPTLASVPPILGSGSNPGSNPPRADVELATWGLVKDLFSE